MAISDLIGDLFTCTLDNGFNCYMSSRHESVTAYGHAACNGEITASACKFCLDAANEYRHYDCDMSIEAQIKLQDCRFRYELYPFTD